MNIEFAENGAYVAFYKKKQRLLDKIISWTSRGKYSHVELVLPSTGYSYSSSGRDGGVRYKNIDEMNFLDTEKWDIFRLNQDDYDLDLQSLTEFNDLYECGENTHMVDRRGRYDYLSIIFYHLLRLVFLPKLQNHKFICTEYVMEALEASMKPKYDEYPGYIRWINSKEEINHGFKLTPCNLLNSLTYIGLIKEPVFFVSMKEEERLKDIKWDKSINKLLAKKEGRNDR